MSVQDIIKHRRLELDMTLKDVAKILGVAEATVSRYESGDIQNMGIDKIELLSRALRCSPGYLMGFESEPNGKPNISDLKESEMNLLSTFRRLNSDGKQKLLERADELVDLGFTVQQTNKKDA